MPISEYCINISANSSVRFIAPRRPVSSSALFACRNPFLPLFIFSLLLLAWPFESLLADTIFLKNGQEVEGEIIGISRNFFRIRTANGVQRINKKDLASVSINPRRLAALKAAEERRIERERREAEKRELDKKRRAEEERERLAKREPVVVGPLNRLWRSALLPGWGQLYWGSDLAGWLFMGSFGALLTANLIYLQEYNTQTDSLDAANARVAQLNNEGADPDVIDAAANEANDIAASADSAGSIVNNTAIALIGVYVIQLWHAYFDGFLPTSSPPKRVVKQDTLFLRFVPPKTASTSLPLTNYGLHRLEVGYRLSY